MVCVTADTGERIRPRLFQPSVELAACAGGDADRDGRAPLVFVDGRRWNIAWHLCSEDPENDCTLDVHYDPMRCWSRRPGPPHRAHLFQRGAFTPQATTLTAACVQMYTLGLIGQTLF